MIEAAISGRAGAFAPRTEKISTRGPTGLHAKDARTDEARGTSICAHGAQQVFARRSTVEIAALRRSDAWTFTPRSRRNHIVAADGTMDTSGVSFGSRNEDIISIADHQVAEGHFLLDTIEELLP